MAAFSLVPTDFHLECAKDGRAKSSAPWDLDRVLAASLAGMELVNDRPKATAPFGDGPPAPVAGGAAAGAAAAGVAVPSAGAAAGATPSAGAAAGATPSAGAAAGATAPSTLPSDSALSPIAAK
eukprot:Hpha_TRINITY_DN5872_c0_g1::TRINITY_DN5872_c0_g1_i1::g.45649::m.45649